MNVLTLGGWGYCNLQLRHYAIPSRSNKSGRGIKECVVFGTEDAERNY